MVRGHPASCLAGGLRGDADRRVPSSQVTSTRVTNAKSERFYKQSLGKKKQPSLWQVGGPSLRARSAPGSRRPTTGTSDPGPPRCLPRGRWARGAILPDSPCR
jgi:hypothetical protein